MLFITNLLILLVLFTNKKTALADKISLLDSDLTIYSEKLSEKDNISNFEKNVLLIFGDFTLEADLLTIDKKRGFLKAKGNIRAINNEMQVLATELEVDMILESVKIKNPKVSLSDELEFSAKEIFALKKYLTIDGFKFKNDDFRIPIDYSILVEKMKVFPIFNNQYFYTQIRDTNSGVFNFDNLSPIAFPYYAFYLRNPLIPKNYNYQRRIRGFYNNGELFYRAGFDGYSGLWGSFTVAYLSNKNSNGFFTAKYGTFSDLELSIYQDLTDNADNLIQLSALYYNNDRTLKRRLFSGSINFIHDWKEDILNLRFTMNQRAGEILIDRLPEVALNSLYRIEPNTGLQYKYGLEAARILVQEKEKSMDVGKLEANFNMNTPKYPVDFLEKKFYVQGLTETNLLYYFDKGNQNAFSWQLEAESNLFDKFNYILRYRQRASFGKNPLSFENLSNYNLVGLQFHYYLNDFINIGVSNEFSLNDRRFNNIFSFINYESKYYDFYLLLEISPYNILNSYVTANARINNF